MRFWLLVVVLALVGCGVATGPKFHGLDDPQSDEAILYVYRAHKADPLPQGVTYYPCVYINDEKKDALKVGGYLTYRIAPGANNVRFAECSLFSPGSGGLGSPETVVIDALPATRYYIKCCVGRISGNYRAISEEEAIPELRQMKRTN